MIKLWIEYSDGSCTMMEICLITNSLELIHAIEISLMDMFEQGLIKTIYELDSNVRWQ